MAQGKNRHESLLQELIARAKRLNIDVRAERLLREVGYRVHSGRCRLKGQDLIILDREVPITDQVDFLAAELEKQESADRTDAGSATR
ncbi:MAG: hypothetical protein HYV05_06435 [Deltaproteobacteria bacterium]|nr:hypothetical protein [Deltaproteobacteria bacterium]MBI2348278.1 hypothetical protein [Deltaproteobacteria bacterium]MBI2540013.1 hypothetical protein [Deltaproteobacteria bacterium]